MAEAVHLPSGVQPSNSRTEPTQVLESPMIYELGP